MKTVNITLEEILENAIETIYLDTDFEERVYETEEEFKDAIEYWRYI